MRSIDYLRAITVRSPTPAKGRHSSLLWIAMTAAIPLRLIRSRIVDIAEDPALRCYGACLALINTLTVAFWLIVQPFDRIVLSTPAICWPFFDSCDWGRTLSPHAITAVLMALGVLSLLNSALFIRKRLVVYAFVTLLALSAIKFGLVLQDYRFVLNQHYMALCVVLVFLFVPVPRRALTYLIVSFYVWAGLLKLNADWLSGAGLYGRHPLGLPASLIPAACAYVIVLELAIVLGLLARSTWIFWFALSQVLLFHIASFWVVGFFYPILMFLILSIIPLGRYLYPATTSTVVAPPSLAALWAGRERRTTYALLVGFCLLQLVPRMFPGDVAITGEGRMFALNMFDAPTQCRATVSDHRDGGITAASRLRVPFLQPRIACDPIVYWQAARARCRQNQVSRQFDDFDLQLISRRVRGPAFRTVMSIPSFCSVNPSYRVFRHNDWLETH